MIEIHHLRSLIHPIVQSLIPCRLQVTYHYDSVIEDPPVTNTSSPEFNEFPIEHETELCELVFTNDIVAYAAAAVYKCGDELECELKTPPTVDERSKVKINPLLDHRKVEQVNHNYSLKLLRCSHVITGSYGYSST